MHSQAMVHGDLKGVRLRSPVTALLPDTFLKANILVDQSGCARLADFGLLTIASDPANSTHASSVVIGGTIRWMSPEHLDPDHFNLKDGRPTEQSDCYAVGMVIYEVLSGQVPFASSKTHTVIRKVMEGERPGRPEGAEGVWFTDELWETLTSCWTTRRESRPSIEVVLECVTRHPGLLPYPGTLA